MADNPVDFHTTYIGGCQRLPNGNTLICEGAKGRFFEVTPAKEIVWEYLVPFYANHVSPRFGLTNATYRCHRYFHDYPGLIAHNLDLVNLVYGPKSFQPTLKSVECEINTESISKPAIGESKLITSKTSRKKKSPDRFKLLGY